MPRFFHHDVFGRECLIQTNLVRLGVESVIKGSSHKGKARKRIQQLLKQTESVQVLTGKKVKVCLTTSPQKTLGELFSLDIISGL